MTLTLNNNDGLTVIELDEEIKAVEIVNLLRHPCREWSHVILKTKDGCISIGKDIIQKSIITIK